MGYTHYWYSPYAHHDPTIWNAFISDIRKIHSNLPEFSHSSGDYHGNDPLIIMGPEHNAWIPIFWVEAVEFNGNWENDMTCEDFVIVRDSKLEHNPDDREFTLCKTARFPYDFFVQCVLLKDLFGSEISW